jgi:hypothetical protein
MRNKGWLEIIEEVMMARRLRVQLTLAGERIERQRMRQE